MIQFIDVCKEYINGVKALDEVNLHIDKGEFVFLVGPSGAGKSTFLNLLLREEKPSNGRVMIGGKSLNRLKKREVSRLRKNIGVVFQDFSLINTLTVFENVAFTLEVIEKSKKEINERVPLILESLGLKDKLKAFPNQLSGGEQQRVAIARAIVNSPRILLADEPTGNLDPDTSWEILEILKKINAKGTTMIIATHDKSIVDEGGKRVIALEKGKVVRDEEGGSYGYED
ncbi:MAG: cell division ATP-binding protein FtsE [Clostridia bacterium]